MKEPEDRCNKYVKEIEREDKRIKIESFSTTYAAELLGEHAAAVILSPAFFNKRWLNTTYRDKEWQNDIKGIIECAVKDISVILKYDAIVRQAALARYYETLSMSGMERFLGTLTSPTVPSIMDASVPEQTDIGQNVSSQQQSQEDVTLPCEEPPATTAPASQENDQQQYYMNLTIKGTAPQMRALLHYLDEAEISYERGKSGRL